MDETLYGDMVSASRRLGPLYREKGAAGFAGEDFSERRAAPDPSRLPRWVSSAGPRRPGPMLDSLPKIDPI